MAIYSVAQLRRIERRAAQEGLDLMARAGRAAADFLAARLPAGGNVLVLAGPGNNGGDALVAATWLQRQGRAVEVVLPGDPARLPPDARLAYAIWREAGGRERSDLPAAAPAMVVDGLFGIGLNRPLEADWQAMIDTVNAWRAPVLALDVPSGLSAATGQPLGRALQARWTLSFIGTPPALAAGQPCLGEHHECDLGLSARWRAQALAD